MIHLEFTQSDAAAINHQRFNHPHPRVRLKMEVLWLKSLNLPHEQIYRIANVSANTARTYFREFQEGGIDRVRETRFRQPTSELDAHTEDLTEYFRQYPPATVQEAQAVIEKRTGLRRCPTQIRKFLHKIGMKPQKVGVIPAKADVEKQEEFKKNTRTAA